MKVVLKSFLEDKFDIKELRKQFGDNLHRVKFDTSEKVYAKNVADMITKYMSGQITKQRLVDWVNVLWFTDLYEYADEEEDSIASVMECLETLDEDTVNFSDEDFSEMIKCLLHNKEY